MSFLGKILNRYPYGYPEDIIKKILKYNNVSFDIFDTLVKRSVAAPKDVFYLVAEKYNQNTDHKIDVRSFVAMREQAYLSARDFATRNGIGEITLEDIYSQLPIKDFNVSSKLQKLEIECEIEGCFPNPNIKRVFDWCVNSKKNIYIISDMYLPQDVVETILSRCGYDGYKKLYLSSSVKCQKNDGKLFEYILDELKMDSKELVHIGDNIRVDYIQAKKKGICSVRIARYPKLTKHTFPRKDLKLDKLQGFMNNCIDKEWGEYYQYGFEVMGPLLYGFSIWLHEYARDNKIDKLFFMSRDGYLLQRAYKSLYGGEQLLNEYFYASRRSIGIPTLWKTPEWKEILVMHNPRRSWDCKAICYRCGIDLEEGIAEWERQGLNVTKNYKSSILADDKRALAFYNHFKEKMICRSKQEFDNLKKYLKEIDFHGNIGLVDTGGTGTTQKCLDLLAEEIEDSFNIKGCYLWYGGERKPEIVAEYFPYENKPKNVWQTELIEFALTALEGTTVGYSNEGNKITPITSCFEFKDDRRVLDAIIEIQEGALYFLQRAKTGMGYIKLDDDVCGYNAWRYSCYPTLKEVNMFGDFLFYNDEIGKNMAKPQKLLNYIIKPQMLLVDFKNAYWKMGFIKRLFLLPVPYFSIIQKIKKCRCKISKENK